MTMCDSVSTNLGARPPGYQHLDSAADSQPVRQPGHLAACGQNNTECWLKNKKKKQNLARVLSRSALSRRGREVPAWVACAFAVLWDGRQSPVLASQTLNQREARPPLIRTQDCALLCGLPRRVPPGPGQG